MVLWPKLELRGRLTHICLTSHSEYILFFFFVCFKGVFVDKCASLTYTVQMKRSVVKVALSKSLLFTVCQLHKKGIKELHFCLAI